MGPEQGLGIKALIGVTLSDPAAQATDPISSSGTVHVCAVTHVIGVYSILSCVCNEKHDACMLRRLVVRWTTTWLAGTPWKVP